MSHEIIGLVKVSNILYYGKYSVDIEIQIIYDCIWQYLSCD
jgi:hypothetical protein